MTQSDMAPTTHPQKLRGSWPYMAVRMSIHVNIINPNDAILKTVIFKFLAVFVLFSLASARDFMMSLMEFEVGCVKWEENFPLRTPHIPLIKTQIYLIPM